MEHSIIQRSGGNADGNKVLLQMLQLNFMYIKHLDPTILIFVDDKLFHSVANNTIHLILFFLIFNVWGTLVEQLTQPLLNLQWRLIM
jgi:hypothetical protein